MKRYVKIGLILLSFMLVRAAIAACTVQYVYTPEGRQVVCQQCCDSNGNCNTVCY